jgi:CBS domain-containing protein
MSSLKLGDVMSKAPVTARIDETVSDAIAKMKRHGIRELPVLEGGSPVGLVSYTSFIERRSVPVTAKLDSMMMPVPKFTEETGVIEAAEVLTTKGIRGAPVMRGGKMIGFVSRSDLIREMAVSDELRSKKVEHFMTRDPKSVSPEDVVHKAQIMMDELDEKALPVVDGSGRLVGVIGMTEVFDVVWMPKADRPRRSPKPPRKVFRDRLQAEIKVGSVMTTDVVTVNPEDTLGRTAGLMLERGLSTLFVTENGRLVGVVDQADLMEQLIALKPRDEVFVQISGLRPLDPDVYEGLYGVIGKGMRRINKMVRPRAFNVHVVTYEEDGLTAKYSMRARLTTDKELYYVSSFGWDPHTTMSDLLEALEKKVRKQRGKLLTRRKVVRKPGA